MTIFTEGVRTRSLQYLEEYQAPLSDVLGADFEQSSIETPGRATVREAELTEAEKGTPVAIGRGVMNRPAAPPDSPLLTVDEAKKRLRDEGLQDHLTIPDGGIRARALDILVERKLDERRRQDLMNRAPGGLVAGAARLGTSFAAQALDPFNIASAFIPVVGEARYAAMLARAGGLAGRTGVRAGVGAVEGTVGAALVEPVIYSALQAEQADYTLTDSFANIAFGTVLGGGLHVGAGAVGDAVGRGQAWRTVRAPEGSTGALVERLPPEARAAALRTAVAQAAAGRSVEVEPVLHMASPEPDPALVAAIRDMRRPREAGAQTLTAWLRAQGGLRDQGGDVLHILGDHRAVPGLISSRGRELDDAALAAWERGFFPELVERPTIREFLDALDGDVRKIAPRYAGDEGGALEEAAAFADLDRELNEFGIEIHDLTDRAVARRLEAARREAAQEAPAWDPEDWAYDDDAVALDAVRSAAHRQTEPETVMIADADAALDAEGRLAELYDVDDPAFASDEALAAVEAVSELADMLGLDVVKDMAPFDELIETAAAYGRAVKAAAACGLRRG